MYLPQSSIDADISHFGKNTHGKLYNKAGTMGHGIWSTLLPYDAIHRSSLQATSIVTQRYQSLGVLLLRHTKGPQYGLQNTESTAMRYELPEICFVSILVGLLFDISNIALLSLPLQSF